MNEQTNREISIEWWSTLSYDEKIEISKDTKELRKYCDRNHTYFTGREIEEIFNFITNVRPKYIPQPDDELLHKFLYWYRNTDFNCEGHSNQDVIDEFNKKL